MWKKLRNLLFGKPKKPELKIPIMIQYVAEVDIPYMKILRAQKELELRRQQWVEWVENNRRIFKTA